MIPRDPVRLPPQALIGYGSLLGLGMIGLAGLWRLLLPADDAWFPRAGWLADTAIGTAAGLAFAALAWHLMHRVPALDRIKTLLVATLDMDKLRYHHALLIGLVAGIPEEILFRGALQPTLGLPLTALIFGALHGITRAYFLYAAAAGLVLGGLTAGTNGLWASISAHTTIDMILLALLLRSWRKTRLPNSPVKHRWF